MRFIIRLFLSVSLFTLAQISPAQFYDTGTDPASVRWYQIKTNNFRVVYPLAYSDEAIKSALELEEAFTNLSGIYSQGRRKYRTNVLIHSLSTESNGYVSWAPRRMELYPSPSQNSIPQPHSRQLAVHETVHIMQMKALERGFTGFMSRLAGQQFTGAVAALLPNWYYEGDAVLYESLLTPGGRGENPSFNKSLKALYLTKPGGYSFDKLLLGSYRDYTPDHYQFGFRVMEYARARYGSELWKEAVLFSAKYPFTINPVNLSLNASAGLTKKRLFMETFDTLQTLWNKESLIDASVEYDMLNVDKRDNYISYHSPLFAGKDSIIAIKTSLYEPSSIVMITDGGKREKRLTITGSIYPYLITAGGGKLAWAENSPDPRWENRNYSNIIVYDIKSKVIRKITSRERLTAPAISADGKMLAASENSSENLNSLVLLNGSDGTIIKRIATPDNGFPQRPRWSETGTELSVILLTDKGEGVFTYSIEDDLWDVIIEPEHVDLHDAYLRGDTLFFISAVSGTDNLFYRLPGGETHRVTRSRFGLTNFDISHENIIFSDYTIAGNYIGTEKLSGEAYNYYDRKPPLSSLINSIHEFRTETVREDNLPAENPLKYPVTRYRKWQNLFNVHSWMPFYADLDELTADPLAVRPGATLFSQNMMSSLITSLGYEYSGGNHILHSGVVWKGWYPVVDFNMSYGGEAQIITGNVQGVTPSSVNPAMRATTEVYIPFRFTIGKYSQYLRPSFSHQYSNRYIYDQTDDTFDYGQHFLSGRFYFSNSRRSSYRSIYPVWAQVFDYNYTAAPFDRDYYGSISTLRTTLYFPGFLRNHGLRIRYQSEEQNPERFIQYNRAMFPRGYSGIISEKLRTLSADYVFPLFYPDLNVWSILYFKRVRGSLFYDVSEGWNNRYVEINQLVRGTEKFNSFGGELLTDFNLFRIPFDITGGVRIGYIPEETHTFTELVFSIDIHGFRLGR
jgi:hypothetical protein